MAFVFLGIKNDAGPYEVTDEKTGEIKKGDFDNIMLFYATDDMKTSKNTKSAIGYEGCFEKIKREESVEIFGYEIFDCHQLDAYILKSCDIIYNRNGDVVKVMFDTAAEKTKKVS